MSERDPRTIPTAVGAALSTLILATGVSLVALPGLLGADGGVAGDIVGAVAGLVGLTVGVGVGSLVGWWVVSGFDGWPDSTKRVVSGYAAFGLTFAALYVLTLVAPENIRTFVTVEMLIGAGLVVGAVAHGVEFVRATP